MEPNYDFDPDERDPNFGQGLPYEPKDESTQLLYITEIAEDSTKFIKYILQGTALTESITRRYNDFYILYQALTKRWPGVCIPGIPPKQFFGATEISVIKNRIKGLSRFCTKMANSAHFFKSNEFLVFLDKNNTDKIKEKLNTIPMPNYQQLLETYKQFFMESGVEYDNMEMRTADTFQKEIDYLNKWINKINAVKANLYKTTELKKKLNKNKITLFNSLKEYEKVSLMENLKEIGDETMDKTIFMNLNNSDFIDKLTDLRKDLTNPYEDLFEWVEEVETDINSMINALMGYNDLRMKYTTIMAEIIKLDDKLKGYESGKRSIFEKITFKKVDEQKAKTEVAKAQKIDDSKAVEKMVLILNHYYYREVPLFIEKVQREFYETMQAFAKKNTSNNLNAIDLWGRLNI